MLTKEEIIEKTATHVKELLSGEGSGHDWWHILRVWNNAKTIAASEEVDLFIVELTALLHDIGDHKFHNGDETVGPRMAAEWLTSLQVKDEAISHISTIIKELSFKGAGTTSEMSTLEGRVVQDADRLDAIGAIGIARTFAFGGHKNREMYNPEVEPEYHTSFETYKKSTGPTINHFYEKLLLLKDRMHTQSAKQLAEQRHRYMEAYLEQFFAEWNGER